jgi:hypothetical protein
MAMKTEHSTKLLFHFDYHFLLPYLGRAGSKPAPCSAGADAESLESDSKQSDSFGNEILLLQSAYDPNDHTDKHYGSEQSVSKHCGLPREHDPRSLPDIDLERQRRVIVRHCIPEPIRS